MPILVKEATSTPDISTVKTLFREYANWLGVDLCFQGFEREMQRFPAGYIVLLSAWDETQMIGAVGLIEHSAHTCEMKRLYVQPTYQGSGAGRALCEALISSARARGYTHMLLDSLTRLEAAVALYRKLGFIERSPYNQNPESDVIYMQLNL